MHPSAFCPVLPFSCLLPCELCRLNGDCCSVALAVALCLKAVHILHNLLVPPLGITFHCYLSSTPVVAQLLVEIYRATWPEKEKFLCHTNLFRQCLLAGSQTDDWLNIQIHTHACTSVRVCVCVGILYDELLPCRLTDHLAIGLAFAPHKIAIFLQVLNEKLF